MTRLLRFLSLPAIIGPLPQTITPNTLADATQVQANFNWIVAQVNANAQPASGAVNFGRVTGNLGGSNVVLTGTAAQKITLSNITQDTLSEYSGGTYTASQSGTYAIQWRVNFTVGGVGNTVLAYIIKNANLVTPLSTYNNSTGALIDVQITVPLVATDTIAFYAQRTGGANSVDGTTYFTYGSIVRVG